jgi:P63C domain
MPNDALSEAARVLSAQGAAKGGAVRAQRLTSEQRREIAQKAASKQWGIPEAIFEGELNIGGIVIPCAVLEDGTRVLTQEGFLFAIGRARKAKAGQGASVDNRIPFLAAKNLLPYISDELRESTTPIIFKPIRGGRAFGYSALLLPEVCNVYLAANDANALTSSQQHIVKRCEILVRGLATVGIIALVDEATGYQNVRARKALEKILETYISDQLLKWAKTFPDDFYKEMFRLRGWNYSLLGFDKRPKVVGKYTNDIVYARLAPFVLEELERLNPPDTKGRRRHKHFQWLTQDIGHPALKDHIVGVITLMKASPNWRMFRTLLTRVYPRCNEQLELAYQDIGDEDVEELDDLAMIR